jgi:cell division protease FtsH
MTDSPPPSSEGKDPAPRKPAPKRADRGPSSSLFWWLMLGLFAAAIVFSFSSRVRRGETLEYSEFKTRLRTGVLNSANVHRCVIGLSQLSFQDQPEQPSGTASDKRVATRMYTIPLQGLSQDGRYELEKLLESSGIEWTPEARTPEWITFFWTFGLLTLFFVIFLLALRRFGGPGAAMSFGRSRGRLYAQEDLGVTFQDVAGIEEAVEELREIVEFLRNPGKYQALGGRIPRGVLLVGPPGTGKTLLAKAVAGEAGVPFFGLSGSDFVEMFVGVGAARVRDMFQQAGQRSPAIIFIDELDALGKVRGSGMPGGHDEREQTLNALLVEMDGFSSDQSVIVMGATNRPETLDPALMRPGRFDRHVLVDRPDRKGREAILKVHAAKVKMDDGVDLQHIAKLTPGFVGADLANLVNEAALLAARNNKSKVTMREFEEGIERVVAGLEKQTRIIPEDEKRRVAYHEIGHALVACTLPHVDPVHKVSIIPRGLGALGYTLQRPEEDRQLVTKTELQNRICVLLGGIAAEEIVYQENSTGASNDLQRATDLARRMVTEFGMSPKLGRVHYSEATRSPFLGTTTTTGDHQHSEETIREIDLEIKRLIDSAYDTAFSILVTRRPAMEHLTRELLEREVMDASHLQHVLDQYKTGPQLAAGTLPSVLPVPAVGTEAPPALGTGETPQFGGS